MYTIKNKRNGFTLLEVMVNIFIISLLLIIFINITKILIKEREENNKNFSLSIKTHLIFYNLQKNLDISLEMLVFQKSFSIISTLDYPERSLIKGNIVIIKQGSIENEKFIDKVIIYHILNENLIYMKGKKFGSKILIDKDSKEILLKNFKCKFLLEEYGISLEGKFNQNDIKEEFKK